MKQYIGLSFAWTDFVSTSSEAHDIVGIPFMFFVTSSVVYLV